MSSNTRKATLTENIRAWSTLIVICLALMLDFVSTGYGDIIIGNFENADSNDGWGPGPNDPCAILVPDCNIGVTLGHGSLKLTPRTAGAYWELAWAWAGSPLNLTGANLQFDMTMVASEWGSSVWTQVGDKIAINSNGPSGWKEYGPASSSLLPYSFIDRDTGLPTTHDWGPWDGDANKTYSYDISDYDVTGATWVQIYISVQDACFPEGGHFYFDNIRLITISGSITGAVSDSNGLPIANIEVDAFNYQTGDWCGSNNTDSDGIYEITNLAAGTYIVGASGQGTQYVSEFYNNQFSWDQATPLSVSAGQQTSGIDFSLGLGASISGTVKNSAGVGQANVEVDCWADNGYETGTQTDANGFYKCDGLPVGYNYNVDAYPPSDSNYAITEISVGVYQPGEYTDNDIRLCIGAILCGRVLDAKTAEPLAGIEIDIDYPNGIYSTSSLTDAYGAFCLTQLPPGIAEIKAKPDIDSGYAWSLPWGSDLVCLSEGENRSGRIITLEKGALVRGYIKDANGNASGIEYDYSGRKCDGWDDADDINGDYEIRLPVGIYAIKPDNTDEFGALPVMVTITYVNEEVNVPNMIVYTEEDGGQILGKAMDPCNYARTGYYDIIAFKAGTAINDPNIWYTVQPVAEVKMAHSGPFSLNKLPPDANYDIYLCVSNQTPDGIMWLAVRGSVLNVAAGTTGIKLVYSSQGSTVTGILKNADDRPVLGATVLLSDSSGGFGGFGDADCNGEYVIYNVPAGIYTATAVHSKYLSASTTVEVLDGVPVDVNTIIMPFGGEKEGPDLNGDGVIDMLDVAEFCRTWLADDLPDGDFNQDNIVNFRDWVRIAENWLSKAIWYQE
jgi:hypothetical protein